MPCAIPVKAAAVPYHGTGAGTDGLRYVRPPVCPLPRVSEEQVPALDLAAVDCKSGDAYAECIDYTGVELSVPVARGVNAVRHTSSLTTGTESGEITLSSDASGSTPRSRNAPAMTLLKTGAATSPP